MGLLSVSFPIAIIAFALISGKSIFCSHFGRLDCFLFFRKKVTVSVRSKNNGQAQFSDLFDDNYIIDQRFSNSRRLN